MNSTASNSRRFGYKSALVLASVIAACASDSGSESTPELTRDEVRQQSKFDHYTDWCELYDWYDDGVCDEFCRRPDPDCSGGCATDSDCPSIFCITNPCPANVCENGECVVQTRECEADHHCPQPSCLPGGSCPRFVCNDEYMCVREEEPGCRNDDECPQVLCRPGEACFPFACVDGECRSDPSCLSNSDCADGMFCSGSVGTCGQLGTCEEIPNAPFCGQAITTYCSCDGETRTSNNTCVFDRIDHYGPCDGPQCQPVLCAIACEFGFETGDDGCAICRCADGPPMP